MNFSLEIFLPIFMSLVCVEEFFSSRNRNKTILLRMKDVTFILLALTVLLITFKKGMLDLAMTSLAISLGVLILSMSFHLIRKRFIK